MHYEAGLAGSKGRHQRLDPPLLMALDEVTQVCPIDLPVMLSDSAGKGVLITAVCHSVPAGEPLGQARRGHDLVDVRDQGAARLDQRPGHARPGVEAVRHRQGRRRPGAGRPA